MVKLHGIRRFHWILLSCIFESQPICNHLHLKVHTFRHGLPPGSVVENLPAMQAMWVWCLSMKDSLEKEMATHSSILAWRIPWIWGAWWTRVQSSSVIQSCPTLCDPMDYSMPGFPVHHQLLGFTQTHVHWVGGAIQPSHPLSSPFPPTFNLSQHQGLFKWVSSLHQVAKVLEFQLQHQSFQWIFRTDFL